MKMKFKVGKPYSFTTFTLMFFFQGEADMKQMVV